MDRHPPCADLLGLLRTLDSGVIIEPWRRSQPTPIRLHDPHLHVRVDTVGVDTSGHREWRAIVPTWTRAA